ncbi:MAG: hypothetical protein AB7S99_19920 [Pseudodonghicola sp.]
MTRLTDWTDLSPDQQLELREAYGRDPACQTGSCAMEDKIARFSAWLAARGVAFDASHLRRRG